MAAEEYNKRVNTSGSIVISDDSDTTDTDYEPDSKKRRLEEEETEVVGPKPDGLEKSTASSPSASIGDVEDKHGGNSDSDTQTSLPSPNATNVVITSIHDTFVQLGVPLRLQSRGLRFGLPRPPPRRSSDSNAALPQTPNEAALDGPLTTEDSGSPNGSPNAVSVYSESTSTSTQSSSSENDAKDTLLDRQRNVSPPVVLSPAPVHEEYFTDPMDPNEIPSDLEYSPPRPSRPPTPRPSPSLRHRTRRNAIFERRSPPPLSIQQMEDDQFYHDELEVASVSDINENPIEDANSTSGTEHQEDSISVLDETLGATSANSDNNFADFETMESDKEINSDETHNSSIRSKGLNSSDSEISENDKWTCYVCHAKVMPYFRHCLRCFKIRRNWLPKRPASRRLKRRKRAEQKSSPLNVSKTTVTSDSEDVVDGPIRRPTGNTQLQQQSSASPTAPHTTVQTQLVIPCSSSQIRTVLPAAPPINLNEGFLIDDQNPALNRLNSHTRPGNVTLLEIFNPSQSQPSNPNPEETPPATQISEETSTEVDSSPVPISSPSQTQSTSSSQSQPSLYSQTSSLSSEFLSPPLPKMLKPSGTAAGQSTCNICYARAKDAAFVHNKVAHQYCCFTCADKILKRDGKCPICRERVLRVVKVIVV